MPSTITLDKTDPAISEAIAGCVVGTEETLTITFTPETVTDTEVTGTISSASYAEEAEEAGEPAEEATATEPAGDDMGEPAAKPMKKGNPAISILIGMKGKPAKA